MTYELGFIGAGNMAEAIARGVIFSSLMGPGQIIASDVSVERRALFSKQLGTVVTEDNAEVARGCRSIVLSVKPYQMEAVLSALGPVIGAETLIISIAAGISSSAIERHLGVDRKFRVVRTMPNTPMLIGEGMVAMARGRHSTAEDMEVARRIFESAGKVIEVPEEQIDAVTAMSGSGPAYFYYWVESMTRAGVALGLSAEHAHQLATRTALGAAKMMVQSQDGPAELRRKVTTPGGTTQAAIETMEARGVGEGIVAAIKRAAERSQEMGSSGDKKTGK